MMEDHEVLKEILLEVIALNGEVRTLFDNALRDTDDKREILKDREGRGKRLEELLMQI